MLRDETIYVNVSNLANSMGARRRVEISFIYSIAKIGRSLPVFTLSIHLRIEITIIEDDGVGAGQTKIKDRSEVHS